MAALAACGFPRPPDVPECATASDCKSPGSPFCQTSSGTCVGCLDGTSCPADKPVCDASANVCRGCTSDDQCGSGVCVEADGTCAASTQILLVSSIGVDTGDCIQAPCASISFALQKVTSERSILRVTGGALSGVTTTIAIDRPVVIDGDGTTTFLVPTSGPAFLIPDRLSGVVTIEGVSVTSSVDAGAAITVGVGSGLRLSNVGTSRSVIQVNGSLDARRLKLKQSDVRCTSGTLTIRESSFDTAGVTASNCQTTVTQNRFDPVLNDAVGVVGGLVTIENNVFVVPSEFADLIRIQSNAPGTIVAFNTIVNTSTVVQSPVAITCDATARISSNIIAYNSTNPLNGDGCVAHASLFDVVGAADATDNPSGDPATFFKDRATGDFHLSPNSPGRGIGEPDLVSIDLDGNPRPSPAGTRPDVGAYESP